MSSSQITLTNSECRSCDGADEMMAFRRVSSESIGYLQSAGYLRVDAPDAPNSDDPSLRNQTEKRHFFRDEEELVSRVVVS
jgi:hypothetical protein